jgi:dipeptidyl-peptidase-4
VASAATALSAAFSISLAAQDRLRSMPGYDQFTKMQAQRQQQPPLVSGAVNVDWDESGRSLSFTHNGQSRELDLTSMQVSVTGEAPDGAAGRGAGRGGRGGRAG